MTENKIAMKKLRDISNMKNYDLYDEQVERLNEINNSKNSLNTSLMVLMFMSILLTITLKGIWLFIFAPIAFILLGIILFRRYSGTSKPSNEGHKMHRSNETEKQKIASEVLCESFPNAVFFSKGGFTVKELTVSRLYKEYDYHYVQNMLLGVVGDVTYRACDVYTIVSEDIEDYKKHSVMIELQVQDIFDLPVLVLHRDTEVIDELLIYRRNIKMYDFNLKVYEQGKAIGFGENRRIVQAPRFHYSNILKDSMIPLLKEISSYTTYEITFIDDSIYIKLWDKSILTKEEILKKDIDVERQKAVHQDISSFTDIVSKIRDSAYRSRWDKV